jgi:DNA repair protein RadC
MPKEIIAETNNVSEIELIYKSKSKASERPHLVTQLDTYEFLLKIWDPNKIELVEEFKVLFLNQNNRVLAFYNISSGGITGTVADPRLIFIAALKVGTCAIIIAHNHPSGNLRPSKQDGELTNKIKEAGRLLDIRLLDSFIITREGYFSFAEEGVI